MADHMAWAAWLAAALAVAVGLAHSYLGERYILRRLMRREQPKLFGSDVFTKRTLRFAWHVTSIAWWGSAATLALLAARPLSSDGALVLRVLAGTFAATSLVVLAGSRGRHLSWPVFAAIAALAWAAAS